MDTEEKSVEYRTFESIFKSLAEAEADFEATISTRSIDRDNDVVLPEGMSIKEFMTNPQICWSHQYDIPPIGICTFLQKSPGHITARGKFYTRPAEHVGPWFPDALKHMMKEGLRGISIGFIPVEARRATKKDVEIFGEDCSRIISKAEMVEFSLCTIPANRDGLVSAVRKSIGKGDMTTEMAKLYFGMKASDIEEDEDDIDEDRDSDTDEPVTQKEPEALEDVTPAIEPTTERHPEGEVTLTVPLIIRLLELAREGLPEGETGDFAIHNIIEHAAAAGRCLDMADYDALIGEIETPAQEATEHDRKSILVVYHDDTAQRVRDAIEKAVAKSQGKLYY